jgi:hypothetical protein
MTLDLAVLRRATTETLGQLDDLVRSGTLRQR